MESNTPQQGWRRKRALNPPPHGIPTALPDPDLPVSSSTLPDNVHCYIYQRQHSYVRLETLIKERGFPGGSDVKNPPAMQETWVQPLGGEDALEKEMATHSSILGLHWWLSW